jgi:hypothetical protein
MTYGGSLRCLVTASSKRRRMCKMIRVGEWKTWTARKATSLLIHGNSIHLHLPVKGFKSSGIIKAALLSAWMLQNRIQDNCFKHPRNYKIWPIIWKSEITILVIVNANVGCPEEDCHA